MFRCGGGGGWSRVVVSLLLYLGWVGEARGGVGVGAGGGLWGGLVTVCLGGGRGKGVGGSGGGGVCGREGCRSVRIMESKSWGRFL